MTSPLRDVSWWRSVLFTGTLLLLVGLAARVDDPTFILVLLPVAFCTAALFYMIVPGNLPVAIALTNSLAMYATLFVLTGETNFRGVPRPLAYLGFVLPIAAFLLAVWRQRKYIRQAVAVGATEPVADLPRLMRWLVPMLLIGAASFSVPDLGLSDAGVSALFLAKMGVIALLVIVAERDVVAFQFDLAVLFGALFARIERLAIPVFAFLTFYSLLVIVFACLYRIIDEVVPHPTFSYNGAAAVLSFGDALYFSVITLSTIGYGDFVPIVPISRLLASIQSVMGMLLLLFGFSEIMRVGGERGSGP